MKKKKILYISHGHPDYIAGGAEQFTIELYRGMKRYGEFEPYLLAHNNTPFKNKAGTQISSANSDPNQLLMNVVNFDSFYQTSPDKIQIYVLHFKNILKTIKPDIVHFQHTLYLGMDMIRVVRQVLGDIPIVYTLHEFLPICPNNGQMVHAYDNSLCYRSGMYECNKCFPQIAPSRFFLRQLFIKTHFNKVDLFLAPSQFLRTRYVEWGIPEDKILFEEYGRFVTKSEPQENNKPIKRNKIGFFGQITAHKGLTELLQCMKLLSDSGNTDIQLQIHGANLEKGSEDLQEKVKKLLEDTTSNSRFLGPYRNEQLPELMRNVDWVIVPSIWWENSPLVIQEAFINKRPVICSNIGGMAEKVTNGVNGLHFRVGNPHDMASVISEAIETPGLWQTLVKNIPDIYPMEECVESHEHIYGDLLTKSSPVQLAN